MDEIDDDEQQGAATGRPRRTQAERTATTRAALLDATVECLVELGYAETTTREVATRAGVSRGAQTHHFPTKNDLVAAAVERLFTRQAIASTEAFRAMAPEERTLAQAFDLLWDVVRGPTYPAMIEVVLAGRTDERLGGLVRSLVADLEAAMVALLREFYPQFGDERLARTLVTVAFTVAQGTAVSGYAGFADPEATSRLLRGATSFVTPESTMMLQTMFSLLDPAGRPRP